jgi:magnesium chelatase accessory protein
MSAVAQQDEIAEPQTKDHFVQVDGLRWHVVEEGEGPTVLLVHGTAASLHSWRKVMPHVAQHFHVVALDLPGHGLTQSRGSGDLALPRMAVGLRQS